MKKKNNRQGSFFSLLIRNYLGFTLTLVIIIGSVAISYVMLSNGVLKSYRIDKLIAEEKKLKYRKYSQIDVEKLLGDGASIQVIDDKNKLVYSSNKSLKKSYTKEELQCIFDYRYDQSTDVKEFYSDENEKRILITKSRGEFEDKIDDSFMILDEKLNILYSTTKVDKKALTKNEYDYLKGVSRNGDFIQKYGYVDEGGKKYTLIINTPKLSNDTYDKLYKLEITMIVTFIVCYILMIIIFVIWLNHKIKKPLKMLNNAMIDFSDGNRDGQISYDGPKEFVQICDSFNKMSNRLQKSEEVQNKLEEDKQKMLADISHDLKTPITVIQGYSKAICDGYIQPDKKEQYLNTIYRKSVVLTELINNFHEYSKLEHPDFKLVREVNDICEYIREYLTQKYDEIDLQGFELDIDIPDKRIYYSFDRLQLKRVLENIITNAIKHNPKGTTIYMGLKDENDKIIITIADNGKGIPNHIARCIFDPFIVGNDSRNNKGGSGLGLAISKKVVNAHGGSIELIRFDDEVYKTKFEIVLPKGNVEKEYKI